MKSLFITVEGADGAGKSTQIRMLIEHLNKLGRDVIFTREPGGTDIGEKIRDILLNPTNSNLDKRTEVLLYSASRAQHIAEKIKPALDSGKTVVCDRFVDSSLAYQGFGRRLNIDEIWDINNFAIDGIMPDLTLFFDLSPKEGMGRKRSLGELDRIESESLDFHNRVYMGYTRLCEMYPNRIKKIDSSLSVEEVFKEVLKALEGLI